MPRHAPELECSDEDREQLVTWSKSRTEEARFVLRARIVLACLEGREIQQVALDLRVSNPTVSKWRSRFALFGLRGLWDQPRPGKPPTYGTAFRNRVLKLLEQTPPAGQARWDAPSMAEQLGATKHAVWRVLRAEGIYLHLLRSWCVSTDKEFAARNQEKNAHVAACIRNDVLYNEDVLLTRPERLVITEMPMPTPDGVRQTSQGANSGSHSLVFKPPCVLKPGDPRIE